MKAEGVLGLARSLLLAGAGCVLVSLWNVNDMSTMEFMTRLYRRMRQGDNLTAAARWVMQDMIAEKQKPEGSTPRWCVRHWAPFIVIGCGLKTVLPPLQRDHEQ